MNRDPLTRLKLAILDRKLVEPTFLKDIENQTLVSVRHDFEIAKSAPPSKESNLMDFVYESESSA